MGGMTKDMADAPIECLIVTPMRPIHIEVFSGISLPPYYVLCRPIVRVASGRLAKAEISRIPGGYVRSYKSDVHTVRQPAHLGNILATSKNMCFLPPPI